MSVLQKKWKILNNSEKPTFEKLMENRGLYPDNDLTVAHDPYLFSDMAKAVERIDKAIKDQERIIIFGDYDVDGITASAILIHTLKALGAVVSFRLPHRVHDGYGLSEKFIDEFIEKGIGLVITVDCGIACIKEVEKANNAGIDVIVTDHHSVPSVVPQAYATIHPLLCENYPCRLLTGAGVALKLAQALLQKKLPPLQAEALLELCYQLASLGTVADLGELKDENRLIVRHGLNLLKSTSFGGLKRLKEMANIKEMNTFSVGFQLAPRINAAGRIGDPYKALFLLLQHSETKMVFELAKELEDLNIQRRSMTEEVMEEIESKMTEEVPPIIIEYSKDWHVGILGLVAGRIAEKYSRPTIILQDFGDRLVASARSPKFFNTIKALRHHGDQLISYGGHFQAAGFGIQKSNFDKFKSDMTSYAAEQLKDIDPTPLLEIDCEITTDEITHDFYNKIESLSPFGIGNETPTFVLKNLNLKDIEQIGSTKDHLRFTADNFKVIAFRMGQYAQNLHSKPCADIVCQITKNSWNGRENLELQALDFSLL